MKTMNLLVKAVALVCSLVVMGLLLSPEVRAGEKKKNMKASTPAQSCQSADAPCCVRKPGDTAFENVTVTTGTHFKEKTKKRGEITTGRNNVVVLDQQTMRRSGAATLRDVLGGQSTTW